MHTDITRQKFDCMLQIQSGAPEMFHTRGCVQICVFIMYSALNIQIYDQNKINQAQKR